jgi:hypothetical protein
MPATAPSAAGDRPEGNLGMQRFALAVTAAFTAVNLWTVFRHVMWRDEWQPLVWTRYTANWSEFYEAIRYMMCVGFWSFCWLIEQLGLGDGFFKLVHVLITAAGMYILCRYAPFTKLQKVLFVFGYYPLYEYGTILRNYSSVMTLCIACTALLASRVLRPLAFGATAAVLTQASTFGIFWTFVLGTTYLFELRRRGALCLAFFTQPRVLAGVALALASLAFAAAFIVLPDWALEAMLGRPPRADSRWVRLWESLPFAARGWIPVPLFGMRDTQFLDPWPWLLILLGLGMAGVIVATLSKSPTGLVLFGLGSLMFGAFFCNSPWPAMRYQGNWFLLLILSSWVAESLGSEGWSLFGENRVVSWLREHRSPMLTGLLVVHVMVAALFIAQEQVVPFSGSLEAVNLIRQNEPPDVLVIGDPDYPMESIAGYLGRPVYIASRRELGAFVKIERGRRGAPLSPAELSEVIAERLAAEKRDVVLVTSYPVQVPPEVGTLLGQTRSITDEQFFVFRIRYRRPQSE